MKRLYFLASTLFLLVACNTREENQIESNADSTSNFSTNAEVQTTTLSLDTILANYSVPAIYNELIRRSSFVSKEDSLKKINSTDTLKPKAGIPELAGYSNVQLYNAYIRLLNQQKVIYGIDNRVDVKVIYGYDNVLDITDSIPEDIRKVCRSVVAMIPKALMQLNSDGSYRLLSRGSYGSYYNLCDGERFKDQSVFSECTGFAVSHDKIVTAGHCISKGSNAYRNFYFVFDLTETNYKQFGGQIPANLVYTVTEVIDSKSGSKDYSICRVNKEIPPDRIVSINSDDGIDPNSSFYVLGFPCGLPLKLVNHSSLLDDQRDFFVIDSDTYGGNSGSPVFNTKTNQVEGILVRGNEDFAIEVAPNCRKSVVCYDRRCRGEDVTKIKIIANYLNL